MERDTALDYLLSLHGMTVCREDGYWWKVEAWKVNPSLFIPHGIRYNLTLHDKYNTRIMGMDNAHGVQPRRRGFHTGRLAYDHLHRTVRDKGVPYTFSSAGQLLSDFFTHVDEVIAERERGG